MTNRARKQRTQDQETESTSFTKWWEATGILLTIVLAQRAQNAIVAIVAALLILGLSIHAVWNLGFAVKAKINRMIAVFASIVLAVFVAYFVWPEESLKPLRGRIHIALVADTPGLIQMFMYEREISQPVKEASPVPFLLYLEVLNPRSSEETISKYKIEVSNSDDGPWTLLIPMDMRWPSARLVFVGSNKLPGNPYIGISLDSGTYRLSPPPQIDLVHVNDLLWLEDFESRLTQPLRSGETIYEWSERYFQERKAALLWLEDFESRLTQPLRSGETIYEWQPFALENNVQMPEPRYYRITLYDSSGKDYPEILPFPHGTSPAIDTHKGIFRAIGPPRDISADRFVYYQY